MAEQRYYREFGDLIRAAVGPAADDGEVVLVAATLIAPPVLAPLGAAGLSSGAAADLVASVLVAWLASRRDA